MCSACLLILNVCSPNEEKASFFFLQQSVSFLSEP